MNVNVLNTELQRVGIVMQYSSLIWDKRYRELGDCELYLPATMENINLLQKGFYLTRDDDDMVCIIRKIEITTEAEQGPMLIVTGKDVRCLLDQRVQQVPGKFTAANAEAAIRQMVTWAVINAGADGDVNVMYLGNTSSKLVGVEQNATLTDKITTPFGYGNAGEKIREVQGQFDWGAKMYLQDDPSTPQLIYKTYKGADKTALVKFSTEFHNLRTSDYVVDVETLKNATYYALPYDDNTQIYFYVGTATGRDRFEQIFDKTSTNMKMTKSQIETQFPGGTWTLVATPGTYIYSLASWTFAVQPGNFHDWLATVYYPHITFNTVGGIEYATITNVDIAVANVSSGSLQSSTSCDLLGGPFYAYMVGLAAEENAKHPETITFTADVIPDVSFHYKEDYDLGDLVTIQNEFGISATARITEVFESWDETGYTLNIKFDE